MELPKVIYQDDDLLILDKPTDWVVNEADTTKHLDTVQQWLSDNFDYEIAKNKELRSGIVHRLDKPTSGVLVVAKNKASMENIQAQFKNREVQKTYVALAHGKVEPEEGVIDVPVGRLVWNKRKFGVVPGGREATTKYKVLNNYEKAGDEYTLLELFPKTGRTHQIRVHLKHLGYPIVADKTYAGRKTWRHDTKWCPRLFLHAKKIEFKHPKTDKKVKFESDLSDDLTESIKHFSNPNKSLE